jgi:colanic acid biosynthesis glycosyl transferase WcaI
MSGSRNSSPPVLLLSNQHYYPDVASTGQHLTDLAEHLARQGVAVKVLTSRGHYVAGHVNAPARETRNGVRIRRVRTTAFGRRSRLGRIVDYATFYVRVLWTVCTEPGLTGVIFLTTPPLLSVIGLIGRTLRRRPYGIWSMDLHPDAEMAAGMVAADGVLGKTLTWLNDHAYRRADFVVDLGPYMKARVVAKGVSPAHTATIPVWGHAELTHGTSGTQALRTSLGLDGRFVVMYSGNAGLVHDFADILVAMRRMRDDPRVFFLFVGDGPRRREIEAFAAEHALANFAYRPYFPREQVGDALAVADVHLISLRQPFVGISVPGKLYGIMAAGRPALFVGPEHCETADTIRDERCGAVIDPAAGDGAARIVAAIEGWLADPEAARQAGLRGLAAFRDRYGPERNCEAFEGVIRSAWATTAGRAHPLVHTEPVA